MGDIACFCGRKEGFCDVEAVGGGFMETKAVRRGFCEAEAVVECEAIVRQEEAKVMEWEGGFLGAESMRIEAEVVG